MHVHVYYRDPVMKNKFVRAVLTGERWSVTVARECRRLLFEASAGEERRSLTVPAPYVPVAPYTLIYKQYGFTRH